MMNENTEKKKSKKKLIIILIIVGAACAVFIPIGVTKYQDYQRKQWVEQVVEDAHEHSRQVVKDIGRAVLGDYYNVVMGDD